MSESRTIVQHAQHHVTPTSIEMKECRGSVQEIQKKRNERPDIRAKAREMNLAYVPLCPPFSARGQHAHMQQ